jgi:ribosome-binding factor A
MKSRRVERLNSLFKEVISDMIRKHVKDPHLPEFLTVTEVDVSNDLHYAKVYISVIGTDEQKKKAVDILQKAARMIAHYSNKEVTVRYFPELTFYVDTQLEKQFQIQALLYNIEEERLSREDGTEDAETTSTNGA